MNTWLIYLLISSILLVEYTQGLDSASPLNCHADLPFMSVGDYNITKDNFERYPLSNQD